MTKSESESEKMIVSRIYHKLLNYFEGDKEKVKAWMRLPNPGLGHARPVQMILVGRAQKLEKFIDAALEGSHP